MKKIFLTAIIILTLVTIFSFKIAGQNDEIKITVEADKPTKFDMFQDSETVKGLMTPYQITLKSNEAKFIFKSRDVKTNLKIEVTEKNSRVSAEWPITVLLIDGPVTTVFGID